MDRSDLDRKAETNLRPEQHLRVCEGDIAYNMMRMWQGAFGRAEKDGIVSPAYVVVEPRDTIDSRFAVHWFKSAQMMHLFWAYSYGLTKDRLRLYAVDFGQIPASPPPLPEQRQIADILDAWDRAIAQIEALTDAKRKAYRYAVVRFSEYFRQSMVEFGDLARLVTERTRPTRPAECVELENIESETGRVLKTSVIDCGAAQRFIFQPGDTLFGKLRPYLRKHYLANKSGLCSTEFWVLRPYACIPEMVFYAVQTPQFRAAAEIQAGSKMPRADWDLVAAMPVPVPLDKNQQRRWAQYLQSIRAEILTLEAKRDSLLHQKRGLAQRLLGGDMPLPLRQLVE
ncbi:MAG: restriction endonuclease subunit S [Bryobacterales bacterium]|nr:restriction endonuclease subunit S [Bryobacterales bacterium]